MIATIEQESRVVHPLAKFVTAQAIALLLNIQVEQLKQIRCWANVILVVAKGVTTFVSYADLPPILAVEPPQPQDVRRWRQRWKKNKTKFAPNFWINFYAQKFQQAQSKAELYAWGQLVGKIKFALFDTEVEWLRGVYRRVRNQAEVLNYICG